MKPLFSNSTKFPQGYGFMVNIDFVLHVAMSHLNGQKVFGKVMRVTLSKHQTVALPREGLDDQLLTKGETIQFK